jgi:caa(3)-type oxidase subunit IV
LSHASTRKEYLLVFLALGVLTAIEVWAAGALTGGLKVWTLVFLALVKAGCVASFYMHLRSERNWLRVIALLPAAAGVYALVLIQEAIFR